MGGKMKADIIDYSIENVPLIAKRLKEGEVGIFPCDTIYGLCATVSDANSERIFEIKERPESKHLIRLMTKKDLLSSSLIVPEDILSLWPCALTAILEDKNGGTVGVRIPDDPFLVALLPFSGPIFSTSVNISGQPSLLHFSDILPVFGSKVDFIVKKEILGEAKSSTLIDATKKPYRILRQGSYVFTL